MMLDSTHTSASMLMRGNALVLKTKMSPHIHICQESVLAAHARSPPAAGSRCPAGADSAPHSEQNVFFPTLPDGALCGALAAGDLFDGLQSNLIDHMVSRQPKKIPMVSKMQKKCAWAEMYQNDGLPWIYPGSCSEGSCIGHEKRSGRCRALNATASMCDNFVWLPRACVPGGVRSKKAIRTSLFLSDCAHQRTSSMRFHTQRLSGSSFPWQSLVLSA